MYFWLRGVFMADDSDKKDIVISYQTIFDVVIREKNRQELQELNKTFYRDVVSYLNEKISLLERKKQQNDVFSANEVEKLELQIRNIRKLLINLYEKRERKIVMLALDKSRQSSLLVNTAAMLPEEKLLFDYMLDLFTKFRSNVLANVLNLKEPDLGKIMPGYAVSGNKSNNNINSYSNASASEDINNDATDMVEQHSKTANPGTSSLSTTADAGKGSPKTVRFLNDMPKFLGPNAETYGPFHEDDIARLPAEIAEILIKKGRAELFGDSG